MLLSLLLKKNPPHPSPAVPRVRFVDSDWSEATEVHYKPGSTVELRCVVDDYLPSFRGVRWRHKGEDIQQQQEEEEEEEEEGGGGRNKKKGRRRTRKGVR